MKKRDEEDEVRTTIERTGRRISESGEVKRFTYKERVDKAGTVYKTTEVEKGLNDCGHYGEPGGLCHVCGSFTICGDCIKSGSFTCDNCHLICCPACSTESLFHPGVRVCRRCGLRGFIRSSLREKK